MLLSKYSNQLQNILPNSLKDTGVTNYEIVSTTTPDKLLDVLFFLKNNTYSQFTLLTDIVAYDRPGCAERFTIIYNLLSVKYNTRFLLSLSVDELGSVPSVTGLYPSGN
jgi:NADH-quinone oxidoreductase subunit C